MKVTLSEKDINEACREWLERHHKLVAVDNPTRYVKENGLTIVYDVDPAAPPEQPYR